LSLALGGPRLAGRGVCGVNAVVRVCAFRAELV
jgi:hypothetical protein